jgi:hypothetical protein
MYHSRANILLAKKIPMNNTINQDYKQAKKQFTKKQEKTIEIVIRKEEEIKKIQQEIGNILSENDL